MKKGVLLPVGVRVELAVDRVLSRLRERFEDEGEGGTDSDEVDVDMSLAVSRPALTLALRRRARILCSLNDVLSAPGEAAASGRGGTTKFEDGMVAVVWRIRRWRCGGLDDRPARGEEGSRVRFFFVRSFHGRWEQAGRQMFL